jgi:UTP--glucose-1-phosphate uridylyltransferase
MAKRVRKAVFPVAGLGTRFLPVTKAMPKEMLPVVDKPLIQYAFEEATAAGIEECYFVTGRAKNAIEDHFDTAAELEMTLRERGKDDLLNELDAIVPTPGRIAYTRQQRPLGLGHAVWCARHLVGDEPFAVLLADDLMVGDPPCLAEMVEAHARTGGNMVAVMEIPREETRRYGILDVVEDHGKLVRAKGVVEKPEPAVAPSTLMIIGRYIIQPEIFRHLGDARAGAGGEIQLTDGLDKLISDGQPFHGLRAAGSGAALRLRREARLSRSQPRARSAASGIRRRATQADKDPSLTGNAGSAPSALAAVHDFSLAWSIRGPPRPQSFLASLAPLTATNEAGGVLRRTENRSVGATKSPRLTTSGSTSQRPRCDDYRPARAADALICKCPIQP